MTQRIQEPVMDDRDFDTPRLGSWEGKIPGPKTGFPIPAPEPILSWDDMSWRERIDSIKPGLAVVAALILFVGVVGLVGIGLAGWLS